MTHVTFETLELEGFGPFERHVQIQFSPGMNHYIAHNESGKSTVVAGLLAVIFGLNTSATASGFTTGRFRNWNQPARFRGSLNFRWGAVHYRLRRDFDAHRIDLRPFASESEGRRIVGEHNPQARRPNAQYERWLRDCFGTADRDAFEATFCLKQPLPEHTQVSEAVQQMLLGGEVQVHQVLETLIEALKDISKATADRGVTSRNQKKDRPLEQAEAEIARLEADIEESRDIVESLEQVKREYREVSERLAEARDELASKRNTRSNWAEWRRLQSNYQQALARQKRIETVYDQARERQQEAERLKTRRKDEYPEFAQASAELGEDLDALVTLQERIETLRSDIDAIDKAIAELEKDRQTLEDEMSHCLPWDEVTEQPKEYVAFMRERVEELQIEWQEFIKLREDVRQGRKHIQCHYHPFETASPDQLETLGSLPAGWHDVKREERAADDALARAREQQQAFADEKRDLDIRFSDLSDLDEEAISAERDRLRRKRELRRRAHALRPQLTPPLSWRLAALLLFGAVGPLLFYWTPLPDDLFSLFGVGLGGMLIGYFLAVSLHRLQRRTLHAEWDALKREMAALAEREPAEDLPEDESELARLQERFRLYREETQRLARREEEVPDRKAMEALKRQRQEAKEKRACFEKRLQPFWDAFSDVEAAYRKWRQEHDRIAERVNRLEQMAANRFGGHVAEAEALDPFSDLPKRWREVAEFVAFVFPAEPVECLGDVICLWTKRLPARWAELEAAAAHYVDLKARRDAITAKKATLLTQREDKKAHLRKTKHKARLLEEPLIKILTAAEGNAAKARTRFYDWKEGRADVDRLQNEIADRLAEFDVPDLDALYTEVINTRNQAIQTLQSWREFIEQNPGLPGEAQSQDPEQMKTRLAHLDAKIEALDARVEELEAAERERVKRQSELEGKEPLNIALAEQTLAERRKKRDRLARTADALAVAHQEMERAIRDYHASVRERLERLASRYFCRMTNVADRSVALDETFGLYLIHQGHEVTLDQLSKGAKDQLYLALRFSFSDLLALDNRVPMLLDDPFVACDRARRAVLKEILEQEAKRRQILLFAHSQDYSNWGQAIELTPSVP